MKFPCKAWIEGQMSFASSHVFVRADFLLRHEGIPSWVLAYPGSEDFTQILDLSLTNECQALFRIVFRARIKTALLYYIPAVLLLRNFLWSFYAELFHLLWIPIKTYTLLRAFHHILPLSIFLPTETDTPLILTLCIEVIRKNSTHSWFLLKFLLRQKPASNPIILGGGHILGWNFFVTFPSQTSVLSHWLLHERQIHMTIFFNCLPSPSGSGGNASVIRFDSQKYKPVSAQ